VGTSFWECGSGPLRGLRPLNFDRTPHILLSTSVSVNTTTGSFPRELPGSALRALYAEVGFARSLLAYELPDGRLKLLVCPSPSSLRRRMRSEGCRTGTDAGYHRVSPLCGAARRADAPGAFLRAEPGGGGRSCRILREWLRTQAGTDGVGASRGCLVQCRGKICTG
jgi:hypothetical protein